MLLVYVYFFLSITLMKKVYNVNWKTMMQKCVNDLNTTTSTKNVYSGIKRKHLKILTQYIW